MTTPPSAPTPPPRITFIERLLDALGWSIAHTPEWILRAFSNALGWFIYFGFRRRMMLRNLAAAFPERPGDWHRRIARLSATRMVETGLLALASPQMSEAELKSRARIGPDMETFIVNAQARPRPVVFAGAHFAYWEALTWLPMLAGARFPVLSSVYRPLRNPALDAWMRRTRERFGVRLISRRTGLHATIHVLKRHGIVGVLFDQNAGGHGSLTTFFGRTCSTGELPALLVTKTKADVVLVGARRTGFWRVELFALPVQHEGTPESVTIALNRTLEAAMRADDNLCASWLWLHNRWKILELPVELRKLEQKRNLLASDAAATNTLPPS